MRPLPFLGKTGRTPLAAKGPDPTQCRKGLALDAAAQLLADGELPVADAVAAYPFNSQLLELPGGAVVVLAPEESRENPRARAFLDRVVAEENPVRAVPYRDLNQSMDNGGGPACLRLRAGGGEHPPVLHADDPVGPLARELQIVRDHHHGQPAGAQLAQEPGDRGRVVLVQVPGGLIGEEHGGPLHDRACNGHPLLLPARQVGRSMGQPVPQSQTLQDRPGQPAPLHVQLRVLARRGYARPPQSTAREFVECLTGRPQAHQLAAELTALYEQVRFGGQPLTIVEGTRAAALLRRLEAAFR